MIAKGLRYALSTICLLVLLVFLAACSTEKTSQDSEKGIQEILMNYLSNDSYLEGEDFTIVQNYVRQNEENMVNGYHEFMDGYYLYINRETRALMLMNDDGMIKRITSHTIDCQKEVIDIYTITNGNTYYVDGSVTKDELSNIFDKNIHDSEVKDIIYFSKDNYKDIYKYKNRKEYLVELLKNLFIN